MTLMLFLKQTKSLRMGIVVALWSRLDEGAGVIDGVVGEAEEVDEAGAEVSRRENNQVCLVAE